MCNKGHGNALDYVRSGAGAGRDSTIGGSLAGIPPLVVPWQGFHHWWFPGRDSTIGGSLAGIRQMVAPWQRFRHGWFTGRDSTNGRALAGIPPLVVPWQGFHHWWWFPGRDSAIGRTRRRGELQVTHDLAEGLKASNAGSPQGGLATPPDPLLRSTDQKMFTATRADVHTQPVKSISARFR